MIKKITAFILAAVLALALASCGAEKNKAPVLNISGAEIGSGVFAYYLDKAVSVPEKYGLPKNAGAKELTDCASELCRRYTAINTLFSQYGMKLSNAQKLEIAERVNDLWSCFGAHYEKIGVSREDIHRITSCSVYEEAIISKLFGSDDSEAFEESVKKYFAENYIMFRTACGFFVTADEAGGDIEMTAAQKAELIKKYQAQAAAVTSAEDIEKAAQALGVAASSTVLLKKGQSGYPEGFFEKVNAVKDDTAAVIAFDDCVFLVFKTGLASREEEYAEYRSDCIKELCGEAADELFSAEEAELKITANEEEINRFINNIEIYG